MDFEALDVAKGNLSCINLRRDIILFGIFSHVFSVSCYVVSSLSTTMMIEELLLILYFDFLNLLL